MNGRIFNKTPGQRGWQSEKSEADDFTQGLHGSLQTAFACSKYRIGSRNPGSGKFLVGKQIFNGILQLGGVSNDLDAIASLELFDDIGEITTVRPHKQRNMLLHDFERVVAANSRIDRAADESHIGKPV